MQRHFVEFYSPGTFVAEVSSRPIRSWSVKEAVEMAESISERYNATPYGFRFTTRSRGPQDLDSKQTAQSCMHYLGGKVETLAEIEARNDPKDEILLSNMRGNGWDRVIVNENSWKVTLPLKDGDVVLDFEKPTKKAG